MELFGPGFAEGSDALVLILLLPVLAGQSEMVGHALCALGRPVPVTAVAIARTAAAAAGCVVLVGPLGILGPPVALVAAYALGLLVLVSLIRDVARPWPPLRLAGVTLAAGVGFACLAHFA
jgi:O-antigen/teichoic acid export membrane protein